MNYTLETFTATASGALATYIWECAQALKRIDVTAHVVTRASSTPTFPWPDVHVVQAPHELGGRVGSLVTRVQRKFLGWPRQRQRAWSSRVAHVIRDQGWDHSVLFLQNDVEVAVYLRKRFPQARIVHLFQNQLSAREPFRSAFAQSVDAVAAVSDFTANWIEQEYGLSAGSVRRIYSGVDCDTFAPPERPEGGVPIVGFVGRTGIEKGADILLRAAIRVAKTTPDFAVQVVGSNHWDRFEFDSYQAELQRLRTELIAAGVEVEFAGHVGREALPARLARTSIHVVPSRWDEPFGLTTLEGMAAGNSVVASRTGGTPEVVGDAGILFENENIDELSDVLTSLIRDRELRDHWGRAGRRRAETMSWDATASSIVEPINELP